MKKRHFETFDALRFLAFFKVFLLHLPITAFPIFNYLKSGGGIGVSFFFVLSGFLITYIILEEKNQTGKLNLYHFFARRILRIWPLYYLMVLFALATPYILSFLNLSYSNEGYEPNWLMSVTFLENYKMIFSGDHPNVSPLNVMWSLCIEEHFYIIWGVCLYFIKINKVLILIFVSILIANISRIFFSILDLPALDILTNIDYFAYGAIPALLLIKREELVEKVNNVSFVVKLFIISVIAVYVVASPNISFIHKDLIEPTIFGISFPLILLIVIPTQNKVKISDNNFLSRLGIYTYGLYLYHTIVIILLFQISKLIGFQLNIVINAIIFSLVSLLVTTTISNISYHLFEKQFLKLKKYFY